MLHMLESVYAIRLNAFAFGISEARTGGISSSCLVNALPEFLSKHTARVDAFVLLLQC